MKVLSIGNSFSWDAHTFLHELAAKNGIELETVNLYIGGCSLQRHWETLVQGEKAHILCRNGESPNDALPMVSIVDGLKADRYDAVTFQQASHYSGMAQTYLPYLPLLVALVREHQPQAKLYFHQTWAYEIDSDHEGFANYGGNQAEMYRRIHDCGRMSAKLVGNLIPSGDVIQTLRDTVPAFDYANGGQSLCRDGFHLSLDYGRYAVAACWLYTLTGQLPKDQPFKDFDPELLKTIHQAVKHNA